jgi:hypothetical protein
MAGEGLSFASPQAVSSPGDASGHFRDGGGVLTFGTYPDLSLKVAREKLARAKRLLREVGPTQGFGERPLGGLTRP